MTSKHGKKIGVRAEMLRWDGNAEWVWEQTEETESNGTRNGNDTELERSKGWNEIGITR